MVYVPKPKHLTLYRQDIKQSQESAHTPSHLSIHSLHLLTLQLSVNTDVASALFSALPTDWALGKVHEWTTSSRTQRKTQLILPEEESEKAAPRRCLFERSLDSPIRVFPAEGEKREHHK